MYLGIAFSLGYLIVAAIAGLRRLSGSLFSIVTPLPEVFLHFGRFLRRRIEEFLYSNQAGAKQSWSFLCTPFEFFGRDVVRLIQARQAKQSN
jgi:hypothetical protein